MNRRRALGLFATALGVSASSQAHAFADPESCPEHVGWVAKVMEKMETIKVGDTRKSLLRIFTTEGGLSTSLEHSVCEPRLPSIQNRRQISCHWSAGARSRWARDFSRKRRRHHHRALTSVSCISSLRLILILAVALWKGTYRKPDFAGGPELNPLIRSRTACRVSLNQNGLFPEDTVRICLEPLPSIRAIWLPAVATSRSVLIHPAMRSNSSNLAM